MDPSAAPVRDAYSQAGTDTDGRCRIRRISWRRLTGSSTSSTASTSCASSSTGTTARGGRPTSSCPSCSASSEWGWHATAGCCDGMSGLLDEWGVFVSGCRNSYDEYGCCDGMSGLLDEWGVFVSVCRNSYDEYGNLDVSAQHERFRDLTYPPDFEKNLKMRDMLEEILAEAQEGEDEDEDKMKALEEFVEVRGSAGPASHPRMSDRGF